MKKIDINECHKLLLEIAKEFDRICTKLMLMGLSDG